MSHTAAATADKFIKIVNQFQQTLLSFEESMKRQEAMVSQILKHLQYCTCSTYGAQVVKGKPICVSCFKEVSPQQVENERKTQYFNKQCTSCGKLDLHSADTLIPDNIDYLCSCCLISPFQP